MSANSTQLSRGVLPKAKLPAVRLRRIVCDGFSVNTGYFSLHPRIGGTWQGANDPHDPEKPPIRFTFRALKPLRDLAAHIEVLIEGISDDSGYIAEIADVTTEAVNETLTPGGMFAIEGHKIKAAGENPDCGVYFVSEANPAQKVKVAGHLADNTASRIVGIIPPLAAGQWRVEVLSQYSSGSFTLKEPRTISFGPVLTVA